MYSELTFSLNWLCVFARVSCFLDGAFVDSTSSVYVAGASSANDRRAHIARRRLISNACFQARILSLITRTKSSFYVSCLCHRCQF